MPAVRLREGRRFESGTDGQRSVIEPWLSESTPAHEMDWGVDGLPLQFSQHPERPDMIALRLSASPVESGSVASRIEITYGPPHIAAAISGARLPEPIPGSFRWWSTYETADVNIPLVFKSKRPVDGGGTEEFWDYEITTTTETRMVIQAEWRFQLQGTGGWDELEKFALQHGQVHTIEGKLVQFRVASVRPTFERQNADVTCSWLYDPGTKSIANGVESMALMPADLIALGLYVGPPNAPPAGLMRTPYHELKLLPPDPDAVPQPSPPRLTQRQLADFEPNGAQGLPGFPF